MIPGGQGVTAAGRDGAVAGPDEIIGTVVAARPPISIREVRAELWGQPEHRAASVGYWLQSVQSPGTPRGIRTGHRRMVQLLRWPWRTGR